MPKFEKKYVHFMWDSALEGKTVFFADYIQELQQRVENGDVGHYAEAAQGDDNLPFRMAISQSRWQFAYYDPYYELKCAYEQGKVIQHFADCNKVWIDATYKLDWADNVERYRVKPEETEPEEKLATKRELAQWLAKGNGELQVSRGDQFGCFSEYIYDAKDANEPTDIPCVRKWEDEEWHTPTREYMGLDVQAKEEQ